MTQDISEKNNYIEKIKMSSLNSKEKTSLLIWAPNVDRFKISRGYIYCLSLRKSGKITIHSLCCYK